MHVRESGCPNDYMYVRESGDHTVRLVSFSRVTSSLFVKDARLDTFSSVMA